MSAYSRAAAKAKYIEKRLLMDRMHPHNPDYELDIEKREKLIEELERLQDALEDIEIERF
jgi:hypothetical protein